MKTLSIEFTTNMFGFLPGYLKSALYEYLEFPTQDNWNEIYSMVISSTGKMTTVWQAIIAVDPSYNVRVQTNVEGENEWPQLPTPVLVAKAINHVVFNISLN